MKLSPRKDGVISKARNCENPWERWGQKGWILGSQEFADRLRGLLLGRDKQQEVPRDRRLRCLDVSLVWETVANHYGVKQGALSSRSRHTEMRSVAAWLAKRHTQATLRELAKPLGLRRPQSVGNLTKRVELALPKSRKLRRTIEKIEEQLADRQNRKTKRIRRKKKN